MESRYDVKPKDDSSQHAWCHNHNRLQSTKLAATAFFHLHPDFCNKPMAIAIATGRCELHA